MTKAVGKPAAFSLVKKCGWGGFDNKKTVL